jgi:hypothetical protein
MYSLCNRYEEMMFDFIDGEFSDTDSYEFENHLRDCLPCRKELEMREKTIKLIRDSAYKANKNLRVSVIENLKLNKKNKLRFRHFSTIAACVVLVVVLTNFAFIYMSQKNINTTQDRNLSGSAADFTAENIAESADAEEEIALYDMDSAPRMSAPGIMAETEQPESNDAPLLMSKPELSIAQSSDKSAEDMLSYNIQLYAPDYSGNVNMIIISEEEVSAGASLITDASNYMVYTFEYTDETAQLLKQTADDNGSTVYMSDEPGGSYILYVYLTQS